MMLLEDDDTDFSEVYYPEVEASMVTEMQMVILRKAAHWVAVKREAEDDGVSNTDGDLDVLQVGSELEVECRESIAFTLRPLFYHNCRKTSAFRREI